MTFHMCSNMYMTSSSCSTQGSFTHDNSLNQQFHNLHPDSTMHSIKGECCVRNVKMHYAFWITDIQDPYSYLVYSVPPGLSLGHTCRIDNQKKSACFCETGKKGDAATEFSLNRLLKPYHKSPCHGMPKPKRCSSIVFKNAGTSHKSELQEDTSTSLRILHTGGGCESCHFLNDPLTLFKFSTLTLNSYIRHKPGLDNTFR